MDIKIVSSITRLANYMPLGSYVIYTALETYSFSLGTTPAPVTTIVQTPTGNYTCMYNPGSSFTYTTCTSDQSSALKISLAIGFYLAVFLSFLKQVPPNGTPPLADTDGDSDITSGVSAVGISRPKRRKYRRGIIYAEGNYYYLDFGDFHIWGHAALSFVAFGTLSLFSASVSQCLFPGVRPWIFVFTQVILLVICCFIAMFWIDDPTLSIGLMVVPQTDNHSTQTSQGTILYTSPNQPVMIQNSASTSTTGLPATAFTVNPQATMAASAMLANTIMNTTISNTSGLSGSTAVSPGFGISRFSLNGKRGPASSSFNEKQEVASNGQESQVWETLNEEEYRNDGTTEEYIQITAISSTSPNPSSPSSSNSDTKDSTHTSVKMD